MSKKELHITQDNIFADLDLEGSEELLARSELLSEVNRLIRASDLSQREIAKKLAISQPKVSMLVSGQLSAFSTDTLMRYLILLGCTVEIRICPRPLRSRLARGKMIVQKKRISKKRSSRHPRKLIKK